MCALSGTTTENWHKSSTTLGEFVPPEIYVSTEVRKIAEIVIDLTLCFIISYLGVVTNILVIAVFIKQKFKDSVSVSMTFISLWDLIKCLGCAIQRLHGPMRPFSPAAAESWANISIVVFNYLTCFSTYVSSVLAAYVAVERCLCVSIPFKVRWLITPKCSFMICFLISVVVFGCFSIMYCIYDVIWVYSAAYNSTIAIYLNNRFFYNNREPVFLYYNLSGIIWPAVSFVVILVCTFLIVFHLRKSSTFRARTLKLRHQKQHFSGRDFSGANKPQLSPRDRQIVKMLLVIIIIYVISLSPRIAHYMAKYFIYEFYFLRKYHNLFILMTYVLNIFDLTNGAVNLFVFLAMSSSFRQTFTEMFSCLCKKVQDVSKLRNVKVGCHKSEM
ncbi:unnamed protein product [Candidula unifasciata]|uniref:G-protein coupled receptors family 1 profile domain-containing protein n=1 Tax=Candidula unifasciata TaxID=100452 RepID=A0A8S3ZSW1_9EUPU|nr:unnamed protein product [Candidula unifasciata]